MVAKVPLRVGSVNIPPGFAMTSAVSLAGIEISAARGQELEVQPEGEGYRLLDAC